MNGMKAPVLLVLLSLMGVAQAQVQTKACAIRAARLFDGVSGAATEPGLVIVAGTSVAADLLGLNGKVGALKAGMAADIVAVPGNPLQNIGVTRTVVFVMKDGAIYRNDKAAR